MDTISARIPESFQNDVSVTPLAANAMVQHFITLFVMKRYRLVYRGNRDAYYSFDTHTKKRESLTTSNAANAQRLVDAKNEAVQHVEMNLQIAQVYLQHSDPTLGVEALVDVSDSTPIET